MANLSLPFLTSARAVLIMTDEAATLYEVNGGITSFIGSIPWKGVALDERLSDLLSQTKASSLLVLNDAVEQHYRKEKVPVITLLDKKNVVNRRLNVAFPSYPMRAALPLKGPAKSSGLKLTKEKDDSAGDVYLFAAVPSTESYLRLVGALARSELSVSSYGLLPVESASLVKQLAGKLAQRWGGTSGATWSVLLGQHKGGGLRQIVVKGSELALTRVTPVEAPDPESPEVWASEVSQELQATLSYLSRFGYVPEDGLNVIVLGDKNYTSLLEDMVTVPCNFEALTPKESSLLLDFKLFNADEHYSDVIHAAWANKKTSLTLPITSKDLDAISQPRKLAAAAVVLLTLGVGGGLFMSSNEALAIYADSRNLDVAEQSKIEIDQIYRDELKRKEAMGIDINLIKGSIDINKKINAKKTDFLALLDDVSHELNNLKIDGFEFQVNEDALLPPTAGGSPPADPKAIRPASLLLKFSFAGTVNPKDGNREIEELRQRLDSKLANKGFRVRVSQPLADLSYTGEVDKEVGLTANNAVANERYQAQIIIQRVENDKVSE